MFVQSFEVGNLKALDRELDRAARAAAGRARPRARTTSRSPATRARRADLATPAGLKEIARYADGVGPSKDYIVPRDATAARCRRRRFVDDAHAAGLVVHPYTFRNENTFLPLELR